MKEEDTLIPYTIEELHAMIAKSEQQFAAGQWQDFDDAIDEIEEDEALG